MASNRGRSLVIPMTNPLKAARLSAGWSQPRMAFELRKLAERKQIGVAPADSLKTQISRWENGHVMPDFYQPLLCELFSATPAELGFTRPESHPALQGRNDAEVNSTGHRVTSHRANELLRRALAESGCSNKRLARSVVDLAAREYGISLKYDHTSVIRWLNGQRPRNPAPELIAMVLSERLNRTVLPADLGMGANDGERSPLTDVMSGDPISASESIRLKMANVLEQPICPDIDYLAETALQHASDSVHMPPELMLRRMLTDYNQTRILLSQRQPLRQQRDLYRLTAQLGALIADELMVLGKPHHAASWQEMARRAADETGDSVLRAHVRTLAAMLPLYYGEPATTVRLTREAQFILADRQHAARALAPTLEALACAQLGDKESSRRALYCARRNFDSLDASHQTQSVFGFSERRWRFYESRIMSFLDDMPSAIEAQQRALALYPSEIVGDPALISLDMATCLVRSKDIASGLQMAVDTLLAMPADHRADIFLRCAWRVIFAVPVSSRSQPEVTEYCDLLRNLPAHSSVS
jgi:transcriptional regulator with XRE-family HTH domain